MKLNKSDFTGTGYVYRFSFLQMIKGTANIVTLVIYLLIAVAAVPIMAAATQPSSGPGMIDMEAVDDAEDAYMEYLNSVQSTVMKADEYLEPEEDFDGLFAVQYGYSIFVLFTCVFSSAYIIRSVIEEKASKLVETLMVSVRPLALILGKILAVMTYIFGLFVLMIGGVIVSYYVCGQFMDVSGIGSVFAGMGITTESMRLTFGTVIVVLVSLLISYMMYSIISGISGTCCSNMEEVEGANMTVTLIIMTGYLVSCVTVAFDNAVVSHIIALVPVVSTFCAPVQYVLGNISLAVLILSWIIQLVILLALAAFCTRVYRELIMYKGSRIKWRRLLTMAKEVQ